MSISDNYRTMLVKQADLFIGQPQSLQWLTQDFLKEEIRAHKQERDALYRIDPARPSPGHWGKHSLYGLDSNTPFEWDTQDVINFFAHAELYSVHASRDREWRKAYKRSICDKCRQKSLTLRQKPQSHKGCETPGCGQAIPIKVPMHQIDQYQYIRLSEGQKYPFLVIDVDEEGTHGGDISALNPVVLNRLNMLAIKGLVPYCVGVNPTNGHGQIIFMIDTVYVAAGATTSKAKSYYDAVRTNVQRYLTGDIHCSGTGFVRNPFYNGDDCSAYKWYFFRGGIHRLDAIVATLESVGHKVSLVSKQPADTTATKPENTPAQTGRDLILKARENVRKWEQVCDVMDQLQELDLGYLDKEPGDLDPVNYDGNIRIHYANDGTVLRNQTAFNHALTVAFLHKRYGYRLEDDTIRDEYNRAYEAACRRDGYQRLPERLNENDMKSLVARIKRYVKNPTRPTKRQTYSPEVTGIERVTEKERHVLRVFGSRGGTESNKRRWADKDSELAQKSLAPLEKANQKRAVIGRRTQAEIEAFVADYEYANDELPTLKEIMSHTGMSQSTVRRALAKAGIVLPRGRRKRQN